MEEKSKILVISLTVVLMALPFVTAMGDADDSSSGSIFSFGTDAKALAMGGSYVAIADNYSATYWNPAGLTQFSGVQLGGMQLRPYGIGSLQHAGGSVTFGNFAFGASWASSGVDMSKQKGYKDTKYEDYTDMVIGGTFAYGIDFANFGASVKSYQLGESGAGGIGFDMGTLMEFGGVRLGVSASDVGVSLDNSEMGATYRLGVAADLLDRATASAEFDLLGNKSNQIKAGFEILPVEQFALRGGVKVPMGDEDGGPSFTAGAGVNLAGLTVDIAWLQNSTGFSDVGSDTLVLSAGFKFGAFGESA